MIRGGNTLIKVKVYLAVLLVFCMVLPTACMAQNKQKLKEKQNSQMQKGPNKESKPKELHVLYASVEAGSDAVLNAAKQYESQNGINVIVDKFLYSNLQEKVFSELSQGSSYYDLICMDTPWVPQLVNQLEPMTQYIKNSKHQDQLKLQDFIAKVFLDTSVYNLKAPQKDAPQMEVVDIDEIKSAGFDVISFPIQSNVLVVSYRKDLFNNEKYKSEFQKKYGRDLNIPDTLEEYLDIAKFFTRDTNNDEKIDLYGTTLMAAKHESVLCDFKSFLGDFGGSICDKNMNPVFNSPVGVKALEYYGDWINKYKVTPPGAVNYTWDEVATAFGSGLVAMSMNYHDMTLDKSVKGEVGYFEFPGVSNGNTIVRGPHFGSWGLAINKYSQNKQAAYDLAEWFTSPDRQIEYLKYNQHVTRISAYNAAQVAISDSLIREYYKILGDSLKVGIGRPRITTYNQVAEEIEIAVNSYVTGQKGSKEALDEAAKQVDRIIKQTGY